MDRLRIDDGRRSHRRARSAAPMASPVDEEAEYMTGRIDARGRMGEAWHGHTKDWTIVDVPPGTERVRMDGVGGASTETNWSKYSGVRRTTFVPERDGQLVAVPRAPSPRPAPVPVVGRDHTSVTVYDRDREIDVDVDIDRRPGKPKPAPAPLPTRDMWTEITKDLVCREAIEQMGYSYEETKWFFYIMEYLQYVSLDMSCPPPWHFYLLSTSPCFVPKVLVYPSVTHTARLTPSFPPSRTRSSSSRS